MSALLEIAGVAKSFGTIRAVDGIDLAVAPNEFFALLGPSGCGKTTLLRLIAGFEHPDRGTIRLDGADITATRPNKRPINLMFQSYALFPHMTVSANVSYGLEMEGLRGAALKARVEQALGLVQLSDQAGRKPHQRGHQAGRAIEQQRLGLATGETGFLPLHVGRTNQMRMGVCGLRTFWGHGVHGDPPSC